MNFNLSSSNPSAANELSENEAIRLAQEGNSEGFERLYRLHCRRVYSLCLHMSKDPLEADIVLMGFRHRKRPKISLDEALELNEESRKPTVEFSRPDPNLNGVIDRINLVKAINQLPRGCKKMLLLHDIQGYKHDEISRMVGCSVENSKSQLHRARMRLRRLLPQHFAKAS